MRQSVEQEGAKRVALIGATAADVRDVMVEGESGILATAHPKHLPTYMPSKRRIIWPNGAMATLFSADEPRRLRGPQHDLAWADEICAWRQPEALDQLLFGLRLGQNPRLLATTTPSNVPHLRKLLADQHTAITRDSTYANLHNLAPSFRERIISRYEGTRLGRQELEGILLDDVEGALWARSWIEDTRWTSLRLPDLLKIVVALDPSTGRAGDECGIVVAGTDRRGHAYLLDDRSLLASPDGWARAAVAAYMDWEGRAPSVRLVAEANQGGEMVATTIATVPGAPPLKLVWASKGKHVRAEPVAARYEQGRVHHVGIFAALEDELCGWVPGDISPNRLDATVWAMTELLGSGGRGGFYFPEHMAEPQAAPAIYAKIAVADPAQADQAARLLTAMAGRAPRPMSAMRMHDGLLLVAGPEGEEAQADYPPR